MKKIIILSLFFATTLFFSQKIGFIESYNPSLKHAHLKGAVNMKLERLEDLDYNFVPFVDSLFAENKLQISKISDFDSKILEKFSPQYGNHEIETYLKNICEKNGLDAVIILKALGNSTNKNSVLVSDLSPQADYGIVTFENPKKNLFLYNNIIILYYSRKQDKLRYPALKASENLFYNLNPIKFNYILFNENDKTLVNRGEIKQMFLKDFKNRFRLNFAKAVSELKK